MYQTKHHSISLNNLNILVTGGAGFIGSHLVEYFLKHGAAKVRVLDNFSTGFRKNLDAFKDYPALEIVEGDIRDLDTCRAAVKGMDYVSHQAALGSVPRSINDPVTTNEVNISGFLNMLVAARDEGVKKMVYAASSSTYGDSPALPKKEEVIGNPLSPYAITKYVNELYGKVFSDVYGFHTIGLRYFNVFGPRQNPNGAYAAVIPLFITSALKLQPAWINGDGLNSRDFTFVANAVQANVKTLFSTDIHRHEVINVACGNQTNLNDLWAEICGFIGTEIKPKYREARKGDVKYSLADISKAMNMFGYQPEYNIREGLKLTIDWYKQNETEKV
jgi:UDP-N-acetylglucosamine 4-epimerase